MLAEEVTKSFTAHGPQRLAHEELICVKRLTTHVPIRFVTKSLHFNLRCLSDGYVTKSFAAHGPQRLVNIRFVTKRLKAHGPQRLANKELNTWPKLNNEELFLFPTNSRMS